MDDAVVVLAQRREIRERVRFAVRVDVMDVEPTGFRAAVALGFLSRTTVTVSRERAGAGGAPDVRVESLHSASEIIVPVGVDVTRCFRRPDEPGRASRSQGCHAHVAGAGRARPSKNPTSRSGDPGSGRNGLRTGPGRG